MTRKLLVWEDETEEIDLGDGNFITVALGASVGDIAKIGSVETRGEFSLGILKAMVRSWRGPAFERNGEPVPCNSDNVARLSSSVASELAEKLSDRVVNARMDDETKNESIETSSNISAIP